MLLVCCFSASFITIILAELQENSEIVSYVSQRDEEGYHFRYSTSDGQQRDETGHLNKQGDDVILTVKGFYTYVDSDKKQRKVTYKADEKGYHVLMEIVDSSFKSDLKSPSLLKTVNEIFTPPPTLADVNVPVQRISGAAQATLIGGGLGK